MTGAPDSASMPGRQRVIAVLGTAVMIALGAVVFLPPADDGRAPGTAPTLDRGPAARAVTPPAIPRDAAAERDRAVARTMARAVRVARAGDLAGARRILDRARDRADAAHRATGDDRDLLASLELSQLNGLLEMLASDPATVEGEPGFVIGLGDDDDTRVGRAARQLDPLLERWLDRGLRTRHAVDPEALDPAAIDRDVPSVSPFRGRAEVRLARSAWTRAGARARRHYREGNGMAALAVLATELRWDHWTLARWRARWDVPDLGRMPDDLVALRDRILRAEMLDAARELHRLRGDHHDARALALAQLHHVADEANAYAQRALATLDAPERPVALWRRLRSATRRAFGSE